MFGFVLSACVTFIILGVIRNVLKAFYTGKKNRSDLLYIFASDDMAAMAWCIIAACSLFWFITIPVSFIVLLIFVLKLLTDCLAKVIIKKFSKGDKNV